MPLNLYQIQRILSLNSPFLLNGELTEFPAEIVNDRYLNPDLQSQLQLIVRQLRMQLPVEPLLEQNLALQHCVAELKTSLPVLFQPRKQLDLHQCILALLTIDEELVTIEVNVNLGFHRGSPKLFEWAVRSPALNWTDRIKCWATIEQLRIQPAQLKLVVIALHPSEPAKKLTYRWNYQLHQQTAEWLACELSQDSAKRQTIQPLDSLSSFDIAEIEEVPI